MFVLFGILSGFVTFCFLVTHDVTSYTVDGIPGNPRSHSQQHTTTYIQDKEEEMATLNNSCAVNLAFLLVLMLTAAFVPTYASADGTKTVEFNVKPGGVVHTFTEGIVSDFLQYCLYFTSLLFILH